MGTKWQNLLNGPAANQTLVFSGGACNIIDRDGNSVRNPGRDGVNDWLDANGILFFEPQIHLDTHDRDYDWDIDGPAEQAARENARVTLYQIGDDTMAGVTCLEVLRDAGKGKNVVIWLTGVQDVKGNPVFSPNVDVEAVEGVLGVHLGQYVKNGTQLRKNLVAFTKDMSNVTICRSEMEVQQVIGNALNI